MLGNNYVIVDDFTAFVCRTYKHIRDQEKHEITGLSLEADYSIGHTWTLYVTGEANANYYVFGQFLKKLDVGGGQSPVIRK